MANNLTQFFIETTPKRVDVLDTGLRETERLVFDTLAGMQITEMSTHAYIRTSTLNKKRKA
jgi:hypothetical protein